MIDLFITSGLSAALTVFAAWPLREIAIKFGILDRPGSHKSHRRPVPYLGGIAVLFGALTALFLVHPEVRRIPVLMMLIAGLGLIDDLLSASVAGKLISETAVAIAAVALGFSWHLTDSQAINGAVSVLWIVGLTNSYNLLDNMDGLASVAAATALIAFAVTVSPVAPLAIALAGGLIGFLVYNRPPAQMYLGDAGSLMIGFTVAIVSIFAANRQSGLHSVAMLAGPAVVAVFDTSLVIVSRLLTGRPIQLGGRDHFSHRLRMLGWSQPLILVAAAVVTLAGAAAAHAALLYPLADAWLAVPVIVALAGAWLRLLRVDPYSAGVNFQPEVFSA